MIVLPVTIYRLLLLITRSALNAVFCVIYATRQILVLNVLQLCYYIFAREYQLQCMGVASI